jgi:hypothetical protein
MPGPAFDSAAIARAIDDAKQIWAIESRKEFHRLLGLEEANRYRELEKARAILTPSDARRIELSLDQCIVQAKRIERALALVRAMAQPACSQAPVPAPPTMPNHASDTGDDTSKEPLTIWRVLGIAVALFTASPLFFVGLSAAAVWLVVGGYDASEYLVVASARVTSWAWWAQCLGLACAGSLLVAAIPVLDAGRSVRATCLLVVVLVGSALYLAYTSWGLDARRGEAVVRWTGELYVDIGHDTVVPVAASSRAVRMVVLPDVDPTTTCALVRLAWFARRRSESEFYFARPEACAAVFGDRLAEFLNVGRADRRRGQ